MGKMGKMKMMTGASGAAASGAAGAGGIAGSGIMGHIVTGTVVQCSATDTSMFCALSKIVNGLILILILFGILFLIYYLLKQYVFTKRGGGLSAGRNDEIFGGYVYSKKSRTMRTRTK